MVRVLLPLWLCAAAGLCLAGPTGADLQPFAVVGGAQPIVISEAAGTSVDDPVIAGQQVFVDWAVQNAGTALAPASVTALLVDGEVVHEMATMALNASAIVDQFDFGTLFSAPGSHTVTLRVDANDDVAESDETNNEFERTVVVLPPPFPAGVAVVVLPGILGSQLHCGTTADSFWPTASNTELLHLQFILDSWVTNITAPQQLDILPGCVGANDLDPYCMLAEAATDFGLVPGDIFAPNPGESFFFFPYDWRQHLQVIVGFHPSGHYSANTLSERLAHLQTLGINEVYFVCHSMGSLVAKEYLAETAGHTPPLPATKVAFAGAPFLGSVELLRALMYGRDFGSAAVTKFILRRMHGPYALIPSRAYFDTAPFPGVLRFDWAVGSGHAPVRTEPLVLDDYDDYLSFLAATALFLPDPWQVTRELLDVEIIPPVEACATTAGTPMRDDYMHWLGLIGSNGWHSSRDHWPIPSSVDVVQLFGTGRPTVVQLREYPRDGGTDEKLLLDTQFDASRGDGTVVRSSMEGLVTTGTLQEFELATSHSAYFFERTVGHDLFHVFAGSDPASLRNLQTPAVAPPPALPELQLHVNGPAYAHARDANGAHVGQAPGSLIDEEIPATFHYRIGEDDAYESIIVTDRSTATAISTVTLEVEGLASGVAHVKIDVAFGADETLEVIFGDVPVEVGSRAMIALGPDPALYELLNDLDGDGMVDSVVTPALNHLWFVRGDIDGDGSLGIVDGILTVQHVLNFADVPCAPAADANGDSRTDITDAVYLIYFVFGAGPPPPAPFPQCESHPSRFDCRVSSC